MTNCSKSNVYHWAFFVSHKDRNDYSKIIDLFSNLFRTRKRQELAFVRKNNLLHIKVLDYIKLVEKITLTKQVNTSKIAIIEQFLFSKT